MIVLCTSQQVEASEVFAARSKWGNGYITDYYVLTETVQNISYGLKCQTNRIAVNYPHDYYLLPTEYGGWAGFALMGKKWYYIVLNDDGSLCLDENGQWLTSEVDKDKTMKAILNVAQQYR